MNLLQYTYKGNQSTCAPPEQTLLSATWYKANTFISGAFYDCRNTSAPTIYRACSSNNVASCSIVANFTDGKCTLDRDGNTIYTRCLDLLYVSPPSTASFYRSRVWSDGLNSTCDVGSDATQTDLRMMGVDRCDAGRYFTCDATKRYRWTCNANDCSSGCTQDNTYDIVASNCAPPAGSGETPSKETCSIVYAPGTAPPKAPPAAVAAPSATSAPTQSTGPLGGSDASTVGAPALFILASTLLNLLF